ncbi:MAG: PepSY domain-containing protein [Erythrobacter sp.]|nr:PepSY domain-containing protein [Erythrobacter sp.]
MRRLAKWHVWLGWLIGVPLVMWTLTGLVMVARPIETVRGEHLRADMSAVDTALPSGVALPAALDLSGRDVERIEIASPDGVPLVWATRSNGSVQRYDARTGRALPRLSMREAQGIAIAGTDIPGQDTAPPPRATFFEADAVPIDFRRPLPVWQVAMADGTHVYVGADTAQIEAVRTRWWRLFDVMWGLHIMDLDTREDTSHPILIGFAALALIGSLMGCVLLFRRRRARVQIPHG